MSRRRLAWAALLLLLLLTLTGCWDRREMNELGISVAMGIDRDEQDYVVSVQVVQPGEVAARKGSTGRSPVTVYQAKGATLFEAVRRMTMSSPRRIYGAHLRVVLFGEAAAREGIGPALDVMLRDHELRPDFFLQVAKGSTAAELLKVFTPLDTVPANKIYKSLETAEQMWAPATTVSLDKFATILQTKGQSPVLNGIRVTGMQKAGSRKENLESIKPVAQLENTSLAVFRRDRLIGWLNEADSKGYNYITNNVKSTVGHIDCEQGGRIALQVDSSKVKMSVTVQGDKPKLGVDLRVEGDVGEVQCAVDLTQPDSLEQLSRLAEEAIVRLLSHTIKTAQQQYKTDFFGFGNELHRSNPSAWKRMKDDWDRHFAEAETEIRVQMQIRRVGMIMNPPMKQEQGE